MDYLSPLEHEISLITKAAKVGNVNMHLYSFWRVKIYYQIFSGVTTEYVWR